jgi:hypothetical protein
LPYVFTGPVTYEYRPMQLYPPSRLVASVPFGHTVWRDATGTWHDQYAPDQTLLVGATDVYPGGREHVLTDAQHADLVAGGYGAYITSKPGPAAADVSVTDDANAVTGVLGVAFLDHQPAVAVVDTSTTNNSASLAG